MAGVVFAVAFSITCLRSALVVDHVYSSNVVQRATQVVSSVAPNRAGRRSQVTSPQRQAATAPAGASPVRLVLNRSGGATANSEPSEKSAAPVVSVRTLQQ